MPDFRAIVVVAAGAAIGGVLRLLATQCVVVRLGGALGYLATFGINVSGSLLIGVVLELTTTRANVDPLRRLFLATGILGGYTTFSTFAYETWSLGARGLPATAVLYALGSVVAGVLGVAGGVALTRALLT